MIPIEKHSLSTEIFSILRDKIVFMEYPPGMALSDKELCKTFKVSATPLREAIRKLEEMRLVTVIPRYGTYVSSIDINEIRCAFEVKIKLEALAGELAAKRITADKLEALNELIKKAEEPPNEDGHRRLIATDTNFHEIIHQATQNPILEAMLSNIHCRCSRLWNSTLKERVPIPEVIQQLKEICLALKKRDSEKAARLLENHVRYFIDLIKEQLL